MQRHVAPLFSRVRSAWRDRIYLANHSLGRPLDATDGRRARGPRGLVRATWAARGTRGLREMTAYRDAARAISWARRAPIASCRRPAPARACARSSTRTTRAPRVVATRGEFDSLDVILREYARRGRIALTLVEPRDVGAGDIGAHASTSSSCRRSCSSTGATPAGSAGDRRRHACGRRTRAARRLSLARRVPGRRGGARRRLRRRRLVQVFARRTGRLLPLPRAAPSRRRACARSTSAGSPSAIRSRTSGRTRPSLRRGRRRVPRVDAAGAAAVPGARRPGVHAGDRRRAPPRATRSRCSSGSSTLLARTRRASDRRQRGPRRVRRGRRSAAEAWADALEAAGVVTDARGRLPAAVPRPPDDGCRAMRLRPKLRAPLGPGATDDQAHQQHQRQRRTIAASTTPTRMT